MTKKTNKITVNFIGGNAENVTGSMILIEASNIKILLESGLYQGGSILEDYKINNKNFKFDPKEIDYIFIGHTHIDHTGLLPKLYEKGCRAPIISPQGTKSLFQIMGADSAFIVNKNYEFLKKKNRNIQPLYQTESLDICLKHFEEYNYNEKIQLNDNIIFRFVPSGHIISSAQIELWIKDNNHEKKIVYTSDLGNIAVDKFYISKFEPINKANLLIGEATYAKQVRDITEKDREKDLEKMENIILNTIDKKGKVLIPIFSLDRCQNLLTHLYLLFKDKNLKSKIIVDSPLAIQLCELYSKLLKDEDLKLWEEVLNWNKIIFTADYSASLNFRNSKESVIVLAASGFMQAGRSREWAKIILPDPKSHIIFVGFCSESSLAGIIKEGKERFIQIDKMKVRNNCSITDLKSFSSHIQQKDMMNYYSNINCEKIALVHSDFKEKCKFTKILQEHIFSKNRTTKVIAVNSGTKIVL